MTKYESPVLRRYAYSTDGTSFFWRDTDISSPDLVTIALCSDILDDLWEIPQDTSRIQLVISPSPIRGSYRISRRDYRRVIIKGSKHHILRGGVSRLDILFPGWQHLYVCLYIFED